MKFSVLGYSFFIIIIMISTIIALARPVGAVEFTRLRLNGIASNSLSKTGKVTIAPALLDIDVVSRKPINQQQATFSGILTISNQEFEVEGTIYTHDFQLTSMTNISAENIFYKLNFAKSGYLIGLHKNSVVSCHGRFGEYVLSLEGVINEYPSAQFAPFWG
jgi:hypothetical protein